MRKLVVFGAIGISIQGGFVAGGCADAPSTRPVGQEQAVTGTLHMNLTTTSDSGKVYRLRQASFPVNSFFSSNTITLSSETDPTKSVLETFLNPGSYQIQLVDGWFVTQVDDLLGSESFVPATLLSSSFQFFDILSDTETFVKFEFEVDGQRVTFGPPGRLIVGIGVHERNGSAFCGNGIIDAGESCDGPDLGFQTCASATLGSLPNGFLFCSQFCTLDTTFCTAGDGGVGGAGGSFGGAGGVIGAGGFGGFVSDGSVGGMTAGGSPAMGGVTSAGGASAGGSVSFPDAGVSSGGSSTGGSVGTGGRGRGK